MEEKELLENGLAEIKAQVQTKSEESTQAINEVKAEATALMAKYAELEAKGATAEDVANMQKHLDALDIKMQKTGTTKEDGKSFNQSLSEMIAEKAAQIQDFGSSTEKSMKLEMKAVGDMSYTSNFAGNSGTNLTTEYRQTPLALADSTVYLRDLLPKGTTNAASIWYPRHVGGEGAPAPWAGPGAKPLVDFDFDAVNAPVQWIAGIVRIPRQMLDDVSYMTSFLQTNLLKELYKAENNQILNGTGVSPQILGINPQAQEYNGSYTVLVEKIIDAAYGQVVENGHAPNAVVLNARDAIGIYLNKASTSGVYDTPGGVGFVNGQLTIGGLRVVQVPTAQMPAGQFLVGDFNAAQLITRLNPEIKFFEEDVDNVQKNMITVRVEERIALPVYYPNAFVKESTPGV